MLYRVMWSGDIDAYDRTLWRNKDNAIQAIRKALLFKDDYFDEDEKDTLHNFYKWDIEDYYGDTTTYEEWVELTMKNDLCFEEVKIEDEED